LLPSKEKATHGTSKWLPQLLALYHPVTLALEPDTFLRVHGDINSTLDNEVTVGSLVRGLWSQKGLEVTSREQFVDIINVSFILGFVTLQRLSTSLDFRETPRHFAEFFFPAKPEKGILTSEPDETKAIEDTLGRLCERVPGYSYHTATFDLAQASVVILPMFLLLSTQFFTIGRPGDLPKPNKIPFRTLMDIPSVYGDSAVAFSTCHLRKMTSPEFLSGKWMCYYSDRREHRLCPVHIEFDPPMYDISIVASRPCKEKGQLSHISTEIDLQSTGVDAHGQFTLEGQLLEDGTVNIKKNYSVARWV
jgi:hypothetical protein